MKYDSGMEKQFLPDIIGSLAFMLRNDKISGFKSDGLPGEFRDYLKRKYGSSHYGGTVSDEYTKNVEFYGCTANNLTLTFDKIISSLADEELVLSWSQVTAIIRNHFDEITAFTPAAAADDDEEPSLINKDSFEVFVSTFDKSTVKCPYWVSDDALHANSFGGAHFKCEVHGQNFCELDKLMSHTAMCCGDYTRCISYRKAMEEMNNAPAEQTDCVPAVFDYTILSSDDADIAMKYRERHLHRQQSYYLDEAKDLAEIQERLAKYDGGTFVKWIETETEYSTKSVYNLIDIYNQFCKFTKPEQEKFLALPKTLQIDISAKSAPPELVEQVMNGDITTHKEYIALKKELEVEQERAKRLESMLTDSEQRADEAKRAEQKATEDANNCVQHYNEKMSEKARKIAALNERNSDLEKQIKELESRPVDVATVPDDEINRLAVKRSQELLSERDKTIEQLREELAAAQPDPLAACFETSNGFSKEQLKDFYEMLHGKVLSALEDCMDFAEADNLSEEVKKYVINRFGTFAELVDDYITRLEN